MITMIPKARFNFLFKSLLLLISFTLCIYSAQAQGILSQNDLSNFKADALTESDISQIQQQLKSKGFTIDQVQDQAVAKGMPLSEFTKLKARLNNTQKTGGKKNPLLKLDDKMSKTKGDKKNEDDTFEKTELRTVYKTPLHGYDVVPEVMFYKKKNVVMVGLKWIHEAELCLGII